MKIRAKDARHTTRGGVHRERRYRRYDRRDVPRRDDIDAANRFGAGDGDGDESRGAAGRDARRDAAPPTVARNVARVKCRRERVVPTRERRADERRLDE